MAASTSRGEMEMNKYRAAQKRFQNWVRAEGKELYNAAKSAAEELEGHHLSDSRYIAYEKASRSYREEIDAAEKEQ